MAADDVQSQFEPLFGQPYAFVWGVHGKPAVVEGSQHTGDRPGRNSQGGGDLPCSRRLFTLGRTGLVDYFDIGSLKSTW